MTPRNVAKLRAVELVSERDWQSFVVDLARLHGWESFHVLNSRGMTAGWPDLVLLRPPCALFVELKREAGKVSAAQGRVLALLEGCGLEVAVWRPSDADAVASRLGRRS